MLRYVIRLSLLLGGCLRCAKFYSGAYRPRATEIESMNNAIQGKYSISMPLVLSKMSYHAMSCHHTVFPHETYLIYQDSKSLQNSKLLQRRSRNSPILGLSFRFLQSFQVTRRQGIDKIRRRTRPGIVKPLRTENRFDTFSEIEDLLSSRVRPGAVRN